MPRYCTSVRYDVEALAGVHRDGGVVVAVDVEQHRLQPLVLEVLQARDGEHRAEPATGGLGVDRDHVDLAVRRVLVGVHLGPVEAEQRGVAAVGGYGEQQAGRVEPRLAGPLAEVLVRHVPLLGVVRERGRVDLEQRRLVARLEAADGDPVGHLHRAQVVEQRPPHDLQLALARDPELRQERAGARVVGVRPGFDLAPGRQRRRGQGRPDTLPARLRVDGEVEDVAVPQGEAATAEPQVGVTEATVLQLQERLLVEGGGAVVGGRGPSDAAYLRCRAVLGRPVEVGRADLVDLHHGRRLCHDRPQRTVARVEGRSAPGPAAGSGSSSVAASATAPAALAAPWSRGGSTNR